MTLTIAHLSDVHLAPLSGLSPRHANLKRALGLGNWVWKRRKIHLAQVIDAVTSDLAKQRTDHVIVSGDLVNLGLPGEHAAARAWLETIGPPSRVSVVPGNHDIYCPLWRDVGVERWRAYMSSDAAGAAYVTGAENGFPYVRLLGRLAIVGVNSAVPTPPFYANGRVGNVQLGALAQTLARLGRDLLTRLVVIHHPPLPGQADARRGLVDADELERVLTTHGAELVVHGHNHRDMDAVRQGPNGRIEVVGVASASVGRSHGREPLGRYNLIHIAPGDPSSGVEIVTRGLTEPGRPIVEVMRRRIGTDSAGSSAESGSTLPS